MTETALAVHAEFQLGSSPLRPADVFSEVLPWLAVLLGFVLIAAIVLTVLRRRLRRASEDGDGGFTLHDLRALRAEGKINEEEFERAKAAIISHVRSAPNLEDLGDQPPSAPGFRK